jgi:hypothetical protein
LLRTSKEKLAIPARRLLDAAQWLFQRAIEQDQGIARQEAECRFRSFQRERKMSAQEIAQRHFTAAIAEAEAAGFGTDSVCRSLLGLVVSKYLAARGVDDVQSELRFVAENCDPDTDFMFMRP